MRHYPRRKHDASDTTCHPCCAERRATLAGSDSAGAGNRPGLAGQAHPLYRSVRADRHGRRVRAVPRARAAGAPGPAGRRGQPARREPGHRHRDGREVPGRRAHPASGYVLGSGAESCIHRDGRQEAAVRPGARSRARLHGVHRAPVPGIECIGAGAIHQGAGAARPHPAREADLRVERRGFDHAPGRSAVRDQDGDRSAARALQEQPPGDHGPGVGRD